MQKEAWIVWVLDIFAILWVIHSRKFINIDWEAYMQQVRSIFEDCVLDYAHVRGNTGPIVYPAGFAHIFDWIRRLTADGTNIRRAQYIFMAVQCATNFAVLSIYSEAFPSVSKSKKWEYRSVNVGRFLVYLALIASPRVHSLFVLRMFNDAVAMCLFYFAVLLLVRRDWFNGALVFSLALSVKMNVLLAVPGIALVMLREQGVVQTVFNACCVFFLQTCIAVPFVLVNWKSYVASSFDLSRKFLHCWSVNFQFVPKCLFESDAWGVILLLFTVVLWSWMASRWMRRYFTKIPKNRLKRAKLSPQEVVATVFSFNLVGIAFSRTLHYQFYLWFFHQVPFILLTYWGEQPLLSALCLLSIEYSFNTYPPTAQSSLILCAAFVFLSWGILRGIHRRK